MAAGVTDIEDHAALFTLAYFGEQFAFLINDRRLLWGVAVRNNIARAQRRGDLIHADRRVADVNHDRRACRLAGLDRKPQSFAAIFADRFFVQPDFYADADITIVANRG